MWQLVILFLFLSTTLYADTIIVKDGRKIKGLVVEEYVDRVVLSTVDGEQDILLTDIEKIEYDTPEQNFMQLGRLYDSKGWYDKAAFYYKKAMDINPNYKEAKEGYLASHAKIWREEERRAKKDLELHTIALNWWKNRNSKGELSQKEDKMSLLKETLGISLIEKQGLFIIDDVKQNSSAERDGVQKGDFLVGIGARLIKYSRMEDVLNELLGPKYSEVRVLVQRDIDVETNVKGKNLYNEFGGVLAFEYDGLIIKDVVAGKKAKKSGIRKGDYVIAIDKTITRYLPLDSIIDLINSSKNNSIIFTIKRSINLRRGIYGTK